MSIYHNGYHETVKCQTGLDMSRGKLALVLKVREDSPLLRYLNSNVPVEDIGTMQAYNWAYSEYS